LVRSDHQRALEQLAEGRRLAPGNADLLRGTALAEQELGRWESAVEHFRQAERLDPRSVVLWTSIGSALLRLRRYPEAREAQERGLAIAPANLRLIEHRAMTFLGEGDLAGARAKLKATLREVEPTALVAYLANYNDLVWVLDEPQRALLLRLPPSAFDDDRATWALALAQAYALRGDTRNVHTYAEEAREGFAEQLRAVPDDAGRRISLGLSLAYLGRKEEAIREGERGAAHAPVTKEARTGAYYQHQLVRIFVLVGEPEKALDRLEALLKIPYYLSPAWLKIDPNFDPLRKNPRFQKLVDGA
jgi:tetratricopeptide (TPR) repeat protein